MSFSDEKPGAVWEKSCGFGKVRRSLEKSCGFGKVRRSLEKSCGFWKARRSLEKVQPGPESSLEERGIAMRNIRVFNDFKRAKEEFKSIVPGYVGMYVCGPTVYGMPHVGHAKSYISFDIVYRYLKYIGDADEGEDKIQKQARIEKLDPVAIAYNYENEFFKAMDKLNICRPSISCRATGHIIEIQQMVETLIDKGYAYVTDEGNVYFDVHKYPAYGQLSGRTLDDTVSGERIVVADDKKNPEDFALWKFADPTHIMKWPSPWGMGYPGWHIECSVMSKKYLGDTFDIHGGGMDNLFPHHECECAQSEVANGKPICNYFLHNNLVTVDGKKMGKSLGNFVTMENLFKQASPLAIRFYILQTHYRRPTDFVVARIKEAEESYNQISAVCDKARKKVEIPAGAEIETEAVAAIKEKFLEAMDDDFNTSLAISYIFELVKTRSSLRPWMMISIHRSQSATSSSWSRPSIMHSQPMIRQCSATRSSLSMSA